MKIKIEKNYLVFPTNVNAKQKNVTFYDGGEEVYVLNMRLDETAPDFYAYIEVSRFIGKELELKIYPQMSVLIRQADEISAEEEDALRPQIHFTSKRGWINDPNGLIYLNGEWHLFYQHNPAAREWYSAHWGHAVSKDLLHWQEKSIALYPDEHGGVFSGCAIVDEKNLLGLQTNEQKTVLFYYTAAGTYATEQKPFAQCLAYSTDGLQTLQKYKGNPILPELVAENRDPNVQWCEELGCYVMALYLSGETYAIFKSDDLLSWTQIQSIEIANENECPNLFAIQATNGQRKWILLGAHDCYLVGEFKDGKFSPTQGVKKLSEKTDAYASQIFANAPNGRVIRIAWGMWGNLKGKTFSQQLTIPCELQLERIGDEYYLSSSPIAELDTLIKRKIMLNDEHTIPVHNGALEIRLSGEYAKMQNFRLELFGNILSFDFINNECKPLYYSFVSRRFVGGVHKSAISLQKNRFNARIIADKSGIEVFLDGGKISFAIFERAVCDGNFPYVKFLSDGKIGLERVEIIEYNGARE